MKSLSEVNKYPCPPGRFCPVNTDANDIATYTKCFTKIKGAYEPNVYCSTIGQPCDTGFYCASAIGDLKIAINKYKAECPKGTTTTSLNSYQLSDCKAIVTSTQEDFLALEKYGQDLMIINYISPEDMTLQPY